MKKKKHPHKPKEESIEEKDENVVEETTSHHFKHSKIEVVPPGHPSTGKESEEKDVEEDVVDEDEPKQKEHKKTPKKKKKTKKEVKQQIENDLTAIYADQNGDIPDMQTFVKRKKRSLTAAFLVLTFSAVFLGAVAWFGFTVLQPKTEFNEEDMVLTISGNEEVKAGEEVTYRIRYRNAQNVQINNAQLEIRYPNAFQFVTSSASAVNDKQDTWDLGSIDPQGSQYIDVTGRLFGNIDSEHSFRLFLNYTPQNFSSEFQRVAQVTSKITESPLNIRVEGGAEARAGKEVTFQVEVQMDVENTELPEDLRMELFGDFILNSSEPEQKDSTWKLEQIKESEFKLVGSFLESEAPSLGLRVLAAHDGDDVVITEFEHLVTLLETEVRGNMVVNGVTDNISLTPGEVINASITVENTTDTTLEDVEVRLRFDAPSLNKKSMLSWSRIDDVFDGDIVGEQIDDDTRRGTIVWNKKHIQDFENFEPGEKIVIDVRLPVKTSSETDLAAFATTKGIIEFETRYEKEGTVDLLSGGNVSMTINSDVAIEVRSENSNDEYDTTWVLTNSFHDLKDIELSVDIFGDVDFDVDSISAPAGSLEYDEDAKKLTWNIKNMPVSVDVLALPFTVKLNSKNPSQKNVMSRVRGKAIDAKTGEEITLVGDEVLVQ